MKKLTHIYENNQWIQVGEVNQYDLDLKIPRGSLGKINGISIEDGNDVDLDLCPYIIVEELPQDFDEIEKNKIYILITKTPLHLGDAVFDHSTFDNVSFTEQLIAGFFDRGNFDTVFFQNSSEQEEIPDDPSINPNPFPIEPDDPEPPTTNWRFGFNSTFPIILGSDDTLFGNYVVGDIPVVENLSDGHYIFRVSDEKQKVGYWQKLNDNTFEVKLNDYLSIADAARKYQPKGSYLTTQQAAAYLTIQQAQENLLTISAARSIYQEKGNYLTVQQAVQNFQSKGNYVTVDSQSYYLDVSLYEDNASIKLDSKSHTTLSTLTLPSATEEKAGLMSANDKQIIRELQEQVEYLTEKVKRLLKNIILPGVFDETNFDESKYQEGEEIQEEFDSVGSLIVYNKTGNDAQIKYVYTYQYNSDSGLTNSIVTTEEMLNDAISSLQLAINPASLIDSRDYVFINQANTTNNILLSDIENNINPDFRIIDGVIYYKNGDNAWNTLTTVENIHSLNVLKTVTFEVDNNMNISYSSPSDDLIITAEIDENGYASVYIN